MILWASLDLGAKSLRSNCQWLVSMLVIGLIAFFD
jgi:hypothetical protein